MRIGELFEIVLDGYPASAKGAIPAGASAPPFVKAVREALPDVLRPLVAEYEASVPGTIHTLKGSVGQGNYAQCPWVAIFDPIVTDSAERGFYIVYLFKGDGTGVHLSLNQGTTEALETFGRQSYLKELRAKAEQYGRLLGHGVERWESRPLDLPGDSDLPKGYNAGNIANAYYPRHDIPGNAKLESDLLRLLSLYRQLVVRSTETMNLSEDVEIIPIHSAEEGVQARWHLRYERNRKLAEAAKAFHGYLCQVCGFEFRRRYPGATKPYIESHHLVPFAEIVGMGTKLDPATDFAVVCANCHRMLHRQTPPVSIADLRAEVESVPV
jgi:5-methylcytosine-specific restriction enzyme A